MARGGKAKRKAARLADAEHRTVAPVARNHRHPAIRAGTAMAELADQPPMIALGAATLLGGVILRRADIARAGGQMLASHIVATAIKAAIKRGVDRTRPAKALADGHEAGDGRTDSGSAYNSFPSGHTAGAVAAAEALAHVLPATAVPARLASAFVGAAQLPRGKHYPSDVVAGAAIGWLAGRIVATAFDRADRAIARRRAGRDGRRAIEETVAHPS